MSNEHANGEQLKKALNRVVTQIVPLHWNPRKPISELRRLIKHFVLVSDDIPVDDRLLNLSEGKLDALIDRLDLQKTFTDAKP